MEPSLEKRPDEIKNAVRQIIGTQFFTNSPNFKKEREYLTNFILTLITNLQTQKEI